MELKDVMNMQWRKIKDWSALTASEPIYEVIMHLMSDEWRLVGYDVTERDVDAFVKSKFIEVANSLRLPYNKISIICEKENSAFFSHKHRLFECANHYPIKGAEIQGLMSLLRVPDTTNQLEKCIRLFQSLFDTDKIAFLQQVGAVNVTFKPLV